LAGHSDAGEFVRPARYNIDTNTPVVRERLLKAGMRRAALLSDALGG
jgi:hypothetical protein